MELFSVSVSDRPVSQRVISHARLSHRVSNLSFVCHIARHVCDMSYLFETKPNNKRLYSYYTPCFSVDGHISVSLCSQNFNFN